jgi:hypothetical protein
VNNKVVARFADGRILKGATADFVPAKDHFHLTTNGAPAGAKPIRIPVRDLKLLIFVKDFAGNPKHEKLREFPPGAATAGRRIKVIFRDGEVLLGSTLGYQQGRPGFFLVPVDPASNNMERCFVVVAATAKIAFL